MPELPEVETARTALAHKLINQCVDSVVIRHYGLRWPVPKKLPVLLAGQVIQDISRRGKYLRFSFPAGNLLVHLGMSGSLRLLPHYLQPAKHEHLDILFTNGTCLRYTDPRRFGAFLWCEQDSLQHPLLVDLGPEPLSPEFNAHYLYQACQKRRIAIKLLLMNSKIVVGVGNIYANEALYAAGLSPLLPANGLDKGACQKLVDAIKRVLKKAIHAGGTTLNDFYQTDGKPGYFRHQLQVYGRVSEPCFQCETLIQKVILGQRATFFCPKCQLRQES